LTNSEGVDKFGQIVSCMLRPFDSKAAGRWKGQKSATGKRKLIDLFVELIHKRR
jgi:hypothetical protein